MKYFAPTCLSLYADNEAQHMQAMVMSIAFLLVFIQLSSYNRKPARGWPKIHKELQPLPVGVTR